MPEPKKRDKKAPQILEITIQDPNGKMWSKIIAKEKIFSTGSIGYYANDKIKEAKEYLSKAELNEEGNKFFNNLADYFIERKV